MHLLVLLLLPLLGRADQFYPAPTDQSEATFTEWWSEFTSWRDETRDSLNLSLYSAPGLQWAATSFIQPQVENPIFMDFKVPKFPPMRKTCKTLRSCCTIGSCMIEPQANGLFPVSLKISRQGVLKLLHRKYVSMPCRYGGVDSLLLWQGYPNIGLDDKNQFEMTESLPGGLAGLKDLVSQVTGFIPLLFSLLVDREILKTESNLQLQAAGVRVLLPYLPWDQNTNPTGQDHVATLVEQVGGCTT